MKKQRQLLPHPTLLLQIISITSYGSFSTPGGVKSSSTSFARPFYTDPAPRKDDIPSLIGGEIDDDHNNSNTTDHISSFVSKDYDYSPNPQKLQSTKLATTDTSTPKTTPSVKKLQITFEDTEDFNFDSWGEEEENHVDEEDGNNTKLGSDNVHASRLEKEEEERKAKLESERLLKEEQLMAARIEAEQLEQLAVEEEERRVEQKRRRVEAERLEQERLAAEEEEEARVEAERLQKLAAEEEKVRVEAERLEQQRQAAEEEEARIEAERLELEMLAEAERIEAERLERKRVAAEEEAARVEAERIERERLAVEEEEARVEAVRLEEERLAVEEKARIEAERIEQQRLAVVEAERIENERLAAEEEEARAEVERIEQERLATEEEEARVDAERVERVRHAAEEEAARMEAELLDRQRIAAEEELARVESERVEQESSTARDEERVEQERLAAREEEAERVERVRLAAEVDEAQLLSERKERERRAAEEEKARVESERLDQERTAAEAEEARVKAERIQQERLAAEEEKARIAAERLEQERLAVVEEEAGVEAERLQQERLGVEEEDARLLAEALEQKRLAVEAEFAERIGQQTDQEMITTENDARCQEESTKDQSTVEVQTSTVHEQEGDDDMGGLYDDEELDDMYDDDDDNDDDSHPESEKDPEQLPDGNNDAIDQSPRENELTIGDESSRSADEPGALSAGPNSTDSFLNAAAAATSASMQSMFDSTRLFEASTTASLFSWSYSGGSENIVQQPPPSAEEVALNSIEEDKSRYEAEVSDCGNEYIDVVSTPLVQQAVVASVTTSLDQHNEPQNNMLDNFVKQLERMTESHQLEMDELQRMHKIEIDRLQSELLSERDVKQKTKARDEVASQDKYLKQMRELEKKFNELLKGKDEELTVVVQRNEGMLLQIDTLKREVSGLAKIVDEREDEICRLKQGHGNTMMQVESGKDEMARKNNEINELRSAMSSLQDDLRTTSDAYNTLKSRAKAVATELKDRRIEVRNLSSQVEELESSNASFEMQLSNLRSAIKQHELTIGYKDKDMESLNEQINELNKQISKGNDQSMQDRSVGEKAIASYKRKAQEALAAANARLAAANQAREEAESDVKNARSASDDAVERARIAEMKRSEAEQKAADVIGKLESERIAASKSMDELRDTIKNLKETVNSLQSQVNDAAKTRENFAAEIEKLNSDLVEFKDKNADLREQLIESNTRCESLQREVFDLTDEVQRSSAAAFKRAKDNGEASNKDNHIASGIKSDAFSVAGSTINRGESDGTIIMLQQELQGANEAIAELKLALRTALLDNANNLDGPGRGNEGRHEGGDYTSNNEITPLYFAIEKQNELKTARDEINRLANMVGEAESAKQDAYDAMEEMRQKMEEANSRLLRYEKLGMKSTARPQISNSSYGPSFRSPSSSIANDSIVNLEYLKNVMLSFLTAKTLAERRKLVPVVATVLCLTPEEQTQAINSVEQTAGLSGVASSFWENLESKAHSLM